MLQNRGSKTNIHLGEHSELLKILQFMLFNSQFNFTHSLDSVDSQDIGRTPVQFGNEDGHCE